MQRRLDRTLRKLNTQLEAKFKGGSREAAGVSAARTRSGDGSGTSGGSIKAIPPLSSGSGMSGGGGGGSGGRARPRGLRGLGASASGGGLSLDVAGMSAPGSYGGGS